MVNLAEWKCWTMRFRQKNSIKSLKRLHQIVAWDKSGVSQVVQSLSQASVAHTLWLMPRRHYIQWYVLYELCPSSYIRLRNLSLLITSLLPPRRRPFSQYFWKKFTLKLTILLCSIQFSFCTLLRWLHCVCNGM